jgi:hypothetical protein
MHPSLKAIKPNLNFDKQVQVIRPLRESTPPVTDKPINVTATKKKNKSKTIETNVTVFNKWFK